MAVFALCLISLIFRTYILFFLPIRDISYDPVFLSDLLGHGIRLPFWFSLVFGLGNLILLWVLGKQFFNQKVALSLALLYALSPWAAYHEAAGSLYIILLFLLLLLEKFIILTLKNSYFTLGVTVISIILLYTSFWMAIILPFVLLGNAIFYPNLLSKMKLHIIVILVVYLSIFLLSFNNQHGLKNIFQNQATVFNDPKIINASNQLRFELNLSLTDKWILIVENRYTYFLKYLIYRLTDHLSPSIYFTSDARILGFSFAPPIYTIFVVILFLGIKEMIRSFRKFFVYPFIFLILLIPAFFSRQSPNLERALLTLPLIFLILGYGINYLFFSKHKLTIFFIILFALLQLTALLFDIPLREIIRLKQLY